MLDTLQERQGEKNLQKKIVFNYDSKDFFFNN